MQTARRRRCRAEDDLGPCAAIPGPLVPEQRVCAILASEQHGSSANRIKAHRVRPTRRWLGTCWHNLRPTRVSELPSVVERVGAAVESTEHHESTSTRVVDHRVFSTRCRNASIEGDGDPVAPVPEHAVVGHAALAVAVASEHEELTARAIACHRVLVAIARWAADALPVPRLRSDFRSQCQTGCLDAKGNESLGETGLASSQCVHDVSLCFGGMPRRDVHVPL